MSTHFADSLMSLESPSAAAPSSQHAHSPAASPSHDLHKTHSNPMSEQRVADNGSVSGQQAVRPKLAEHATRSAEPHLLYPIQDFQTTRSSPQSYSGYSQSTPMPQLPMLRYRTPQTFNQMNTTPPAGPTPHMQLAPAPIYYSQDSAVPIPQPAAHTWDPNSTMPNPPNAAGATFSHTAPLHTPISVYYQTPATNPQTATLPGDYTHSVLLPPPSVPLGHSYPSNPTLKTPAISTANSGLPQMTYSGFMQTHQVKNVQVFTGNADCKMLIDDWIRDMQYLLEAIELPAHLRFSTVVRHLSGEARKP